VSIGRMNMANTGAFQTLDLISIAQHDTLPASS
jgi:hypothetical protein